MGYGAQWLPRAPPYLRSCCRSSARFSVLLPFTLHSLQQVPGRPHPGSFSPLPCRDRMEVCAGNTSKCVSFVTIGGEAHPKPSAQLAGLAFCPTGSWDRQAGKGMLFAGGQPPQVSQCPPPLPQPALGGLGASRTASSTLTAFSGASGCPTPSAELACKLAGPSHPFHPAIKPKANYLLNKAIRAAGSLQHPCSHKLGVVARR